MSADAIALAADVRSGARRARDVVEEHLERISAREGEIHAPAGTKVACVLSGGNLDLSQLEGLRWN